MKLNKNVAQIIPALVVVAVVLAGFIFYLVSNKKTNRPDLTDPKDIVLLAGQNLISKGLYQFNLGLIGDISAKYGGNKVAEKINFDISALGGVDFKDFNNPKFDINLKLNSFELTSSSYSKESFDGIDFDVRGLDKIYYLRLNKVGSDIGSADLSSLLGKWIKFDPKSLENLTLIKPDLVNHGANRLAEKIKTQLKTVSVYDVTGVLPEEKINGVDSFHYKLAINKDGLISLLTLIADDYKNSSEYKNFSDTEKQMNQNELSKELAVISKIDFSFADIDIWISKSDLVATKTMVVIDVSKLARTLKDIDQSISDDILGSTGNITLTNETKNLEGNLEVSVPSESVPLEQIVQKIFGPNKY